MSIPFHGRRARRRAVALLSAGVVAAGALGAVPTAQAAGEEHTLQPATAARPALAGGRYIVVLKEPAAASYRGSDPDFPATRVAPGKTFDADRAVVRAYSGRLRSDQTRLARSVGATVQTSYTIASNAFAARLTGRQASALASDKKVLLVAPDRARTLDTSNTPDFLGLTGRKGAWRTQAGGRGKAGQGTVVGIIDSGIWPESKSFRGRRLNANPKTRWDISRQGTATRMEKADGGVFNGQCQTSHDGVPAQQWTVRHCNTTLIGARYYPDVFLDLVDPSDFSPTEVISARDGDGHGSHTAGTAAGKRVKNVTVEGSRFGAASGMAPGARVAAYKVCFDDNDENTGGCYESSILAAIDDAVSDGVDVINYSISGSLDTVLDPVELAFAHAAEAGVFIAASAGNSGPDASTVAHNSPWLTTVAAATHVNFYNTVKLGNGLKLRGASIATTPVGSTRLVESSTVPAPGESSDDARLCIPGSLDPAEVAGAIVLCSRGAIARVDKSAAVEAAGGAGMILANLTPDSTNADFHPVPTVHLQDTEGARVFRYIARQGQQATAAIKLGDRTGEEPDPLPQVTGFSSRGPALANDGDLLKPDIAAPGADVLAAVAPPANSGRKFDLYSGTSMSSPHIAGLAAFLMAEHPDWSPMQVKSAMMTTAKSVRAADGKRSKDLFAQGAGHVVPRRFADPGLFVTSDATQWNGFIQGQGGDLGVAPLAAKDLNGPSMADGEVAGATSFTREFTADRKGTWKVSVHVPGFAATTARRLVSKRVGDRESLTVDLVRTSAPFGEFAMGHLTLTGPTRVRLPIAVQPVLLSLPDEVHGTGTTGSVDVPVKAADSASFDLTPHGLSGSVSDETDVSAGDFVSYCVEIGAGSKLARFDVDAVNDRADLDLTVFKVTDNTCSAATAVWSSATGSADEQVTLPDPEAGWYAVFVDGYTDAPGESSTDYRIDVFDVRPGADAGGLAADPDPLDLIGGQETSYEASWAGLDPDRRYLGLFEYSGTPRTTLVGVDTRP